MSPKYQKIIAFSKPIFQPPYSDDNNAWMRLSVKDATNNQEKVVQDLSNPSSSVFIPYPGSTDGWSPDGRYMVVIRVANFNQEDKKQQTYQFLDVVEGIWVEFKNGKARATVDNFLGWDKAQEHTAILRYRGKRLKVLPSPLTSQKDLERPREKSPSKRRRFM